MSDGTPPPDPGPGAVPHEEPDTSSTETTSAGTATTAPATDRKTIKQEQRRQLRLASGACFIQFSIFLMRTALEAGCAANAHGPFVKGITPLAGYTCKFAFFQFHVEHANESADSLVAAGRV